MRHDRVIFVIETERTEMLNRLFEKENPPRSPSTTSLSEPADRTSRTLPTVWQHAPLGGAPKPW